MRLNRIKLVCFLAVLATTTLASLAIAQNRRRPVNRRPPPIPTAERDVIPPAALLTERGTQLVDQLRNLRLYEETMGRKHPSRDAVRTEIADIKRELAAWSAGDSSDSENAFRPEEISSMNDHDLRQLVLQLVGKIEQIEKRLATLEVRVRRL